MKEHQDLAMRIYDYIKECVANGVPPTVREIGAALGIKSTSTTFKYLNLLEEQNLIIRESGQNRCIRLVEEQEKGISVPIVGTVAAGYPILAAQQYEGYTSFLPDRPIASDKKLFALRVKGDSMIDAGILDGDIVIAEKTPYAENGTIVVALVEDEATVKTFYKENGHFRLQPHNDAYEPIVVEEVQILGKVIGLTRSYQ